MPDNDFDFEANEEIIKNKPDESSVDADDSTEVDDEEYLSDDEAYMDDEAVDIDDLEEDVEPSEDDEEVEEKVEEEKPEEKKVDEGDDPYSKIREDLINIVGEDTMLKIKDKELRAGDLSKEEAVMYLQKGIRADDLFNENANVRRELENERALVTKGAQAVTQLLDKQGAPDTQPQDVALQNVLTKLQVGEYDAEEVKTLKLVATELVKELDTMKTEFRQGQVNTYESAVVSEIGVLKKQFPLASVDEVLAVKTSHPDASLERLMEAGHNYYASQEFIGQALSANPQAKREYDEKVIRDYNLKRGKTKNVPLRRSRSSGSKKVSEKPSVKMGFDYDFDKAEALGKDYLREVTRSRG
jgi:dephospho-CoA kinase